MGPALPAGWTWTTLGKAAVVSPRDPALDSAAPFVTMSAVEVGVRHPVSYEQRGSRAGIRARGDDVLFARITPCLENGKVALLPTFAEPTGGSTEFIVIRPTPAVDPVFLYYWCLHPDVRNDARHQMAGVTGRMRLGGSDLAKFELPLPPLAEQRRIVDVLEDHLSRLDAAEADLAIVQARAGSLQRIRPDPASPEFSFPRRTLKSILREPLRNGHSGRVDHSSTGIRAVTLSAVTKNEFSERYTKMTDTPESKAEALWLKDGDIFVQRSNTPDLVGSSALYRGPNDWAVFPDLLIRVRADEHEVLPEYLAEVLRSESVKAYFRRSARGLSGSMPKISQSTIEDVTVPLPAIERQQQWVVEAHASVTSSARLGRSVTTASAQSAALRRSILRAAFSGELVDQDPFDEPAEVALARIREQQSEIVPRRRRKGVRAK